MNILELLVCGELSTVNTTSLTLNHLVIYMICRTRSGIVLVVTPAICGGVEMFVLTVHFSLTQAVWVWAFPDPGCVGVRLS